MLNLLRSLGAEVEGEGTPTLRITCGEIRSSEPDPGLVGRLRGSVLLLGSLLGRTGRAKLAPPGGDFPARRTITTHLRALGAMGATVTEEATGHVVDAPDGLIGASVYLLEASVTGTETALLGAAAARGVTEIRNAACEPHVAELTEFLAAMGARIEGIGTSTIRIEGQPALRGATHTLRGDYIEAASWAVVGAITSGGRRDPRRARGRSRADDGRARGDGARLRSGRSAAGGPALTPARREAHHDRACGPAFRATSSAW